MIGSTRARTALLAVIGSVLMGPGPLARAASSAAPSPQPKPTAASPVVTFGLQPAHNGKDDGRSYLAYSATPGATVDDQVLLHNYATIPITVSVYPTDETNGADGQLVALPSSKTPTAAGTWISLQLPGALHYVLPPRSQTLVPVHVAVPANATPGDHVGAIVISLPTFANSKSGPKIKVEQRVALRMFLRVSGPIHAVLSIERLKSSYKQTLNPVAGGTERVRYVVHNTGNVVLAAHQSVKVSGLLGTRFAAHVVDLPQLLPGAAFAATVDVSGVLPTVRVKATVTLTPLTLPGQPDPGLSDISAHRSGWAVPWALLVLLALVAALVVWARRRRRRLRGERGAMSGDAGLNGR